MRSSIYCTTLTPVSELVLKCANVVLLVWPELKKTQRQTNCSKQNSLKQYGLSLLTSGMLVISQNGAGDIEGKQKYGLHSNCLFKGSLNTVTQRSHIMYLNVSGYSCGYGCWLGFVCCHWSYVFFYTMCLCIIIFSMLNDVGSKIVRLQVNN